MTNPPGLSGTFGHYHSRPYHPSPSSLTLLSPYGLKHPSLTTFPASTPFGLITLTLFQPLRFPPLPSLTYARSVRSTHLFPTRSYRSLRHPRTSLPLGYSLRLYPPGRG